jgi:hypothetical protein
LQAAPENAQTVAPRLLRNVEVINKIKELKAERAKRTEITADSVLRQQAALANSSLGDIVDFRCTTACRSGCNAAA